jgi:hypothetical protein
VVLIARHTRDGWPVTGFGGRCPFNNLKQEKANNMNDPDCVRVIKHKIFDAITDEDAEHALSALCTMFVFVMTTVCPTYRRNILCDLPA